MIKRLKAYLIIVTLSMLMGGLLNVVWYFAGGELTKNTLLYYMKIGVIFGSVSIIALSAIIFKIRKPIQAYLINILMEIALYAGLFAVQNRRYAQWGNIRRWVIIGLISIIFSTLMTAYWYRKMKWFNKLLVQKKKEFENMD